MKNTLIFTLLFAFLSCQNDPNQAQKMPVKTGSETPEETTIALDKVSDIAPPKGFKRDETTSFGDFLRQIKLN